MSVYLCVLFLLTIAVSVESLTCSCLCGTNTYYPSGSCSSSSSCASTCYSSYGLCSYYNTRGCCGSQACVYYSSTYNSYSGSYYNTCKCLCGSLSSSVASIVGSAKMDNCDVTNCQLACNSLYPTTCGISTNQAYCTSGTNYHRFDIHLLIFTVLAVYLAQKIF